MLASGLHVHLPTHVNIHMSNTQIVKLDPVSGFWNMNIDYVYVYMLHLYITCTHNYNYLLIRVYLQGGAI